MQFQNYDYTQPFQPKPDLYDGMVVYNKEHGLKTERDERYDAGMDLGSPETADIRIVSLGHAGVGLSSFILKAVYNEYSEEPWNNNLLSWDQHQFEYVYENEKIRIAFSDLKGFDSAVNKSDMNESIQKALEYSNVVLLFYSTTSPHSFSTDYGIQEITQCVDRNLSLLNQRKIVLLIGTKTDLNADNEQPITTQQGQDLANQFGEIPFFEISNKTGENITQVMDQICDIYKYDSANYGSANPMQPTTNTAAAQLVPGPDGDGDDDDEYKLALAIDDDADEDDAAFVIKDKLTFSPHCCCCSWIEHCLLNYECCGTFCGGLCYVPFMFLLYLLWLLQIPITLLINLVAFIFCCNFCKCEFCRGALFIADDESVPNAHDGVMLHTAQSIRDLHVQNAPILLQPNSPSQETEVGHGAGADFGADDSQNAPSQLQTISVLQWNIFGQLGRYWKRYDLLTTTINDLSPDILCLQEVVTSKWWRFGSINTIKKINPSYRGFHVSAYNVLHDYNKLFFQYSCCWRTINEFQSCCNLYCLLPFWRDKFWKYSLRSNGCVTMLFNTFNGIIAQIGNAIVFKNNHQLFRSYIPLQPGNRRIALRALYILKDSKEQQSVRTSSYGQRLSVTMKKDEKNNRIKKQQRKKIWIVCTHLSPSHEQNESANAEEVAGDSAAQQVTQIIEWMENAQNQICKADATIICGDFNATPNSNIYRIMLQNGYKSAVANKQGKEQWTFPTDTWKYERYEAEEDAVGARDENKNNKITKDYIWIKSNCFVNINKIRLIGRNYKDSSHQGTPIKIYPSDHLGIFLKLSI